MALGGRFARGAAAGLAALAAFGLTSCDRQQERVDNARTLVDASLEQLGGGATAGLSPMERVSMAERALAGRLGEDNQPMVRAEASRFVIGSIIAKPREFARLEAQSFESIAAIEEFEAAEDEPEAIAEAPEADADESGEDSARPGPPQLRIDRRALRQARRMPSAEWQREAQVDARTRMLDAMEKFGLDGRVAPGDRSGQMVIEFGAYAPEPTQLRQPPRELRLARPPLTRIRPPESAALRAAPQWSLNRRRQCPGGADAEMTAGDYALATECVIQELRASEEFEYVEKDFLFDHQFALRPRSPEPAYATPNDPLWDLQWHFRKNGEGDDESLGGAGFVDFWTKRGDGSADIVVAVVDTGLEMSHPDIAESPNIAPGWDMVSDPVMGNDGDGRDSDPNDPGDLCDPTDPFAENSYHGTHVAGTIGAAASDNGAGVAAGAWNVTIVPVRALGKCGGRLSDINDAIRWAGGLIPAEDSEGREVWNENPADIINLSIGLFEFCPASLQDAIDAVVSRGAIVVAAAGNARVSTRFYAPAGCNNVVTVAAGDARGMLAPYSNFGDDVDVLAPGGDLDRDDDGDGRPDGVLSTKSSANCYDPLTGEAVQTCFYAFEQGTSMAAPHVSAALALLKADQPALTASELEAALLGSVRPRSAEQCMRACADVSTGGSPVEGNPGMCAVPCGGLLDLSLAPG